jgi:hypothetical protein
MSAHRLLADVLLLFGSFILANFWCFITAVFEMTGAPADAYAVEVPDATTL